MFKYKPVLLIILLIVSFLPSLGLIRLAQAGAPTKHSVSISPSSVVMDIMSPSQSQTFTSALSGGISPYYYQWCLNGAAVSGATSVSWDFTPTSSGSYTVYLNVTDGTSTEAESNVALITVNPALSAVVSPASATLDSNQSQLFTSTVSGGTIPYSYQWYLDSYPVSGATRITWNYTPSSASSHTVYLTVTDELNITATSNSTLVTVKRTPSVAITPSPVTLDANQSQLFTSTVSGGTTPFSYQWYLDSYPVSGATNATWTFTPTISGHHNVYVKLTDSVSAIATSNTASVTANWPPSVDISPHSSTLDFGQSQLFTSTVSGGTSPFSYQWYLNGTLVRGAISSSWVFSPNSIGFYAVYLKVADSLGASGTSPISNVTVDQQPTVAISPSSQTMYLNQSQLFTSSVSGGTSPFSYQWYLNGTLVQGAISSSWVFSPNSTGFYEVYLSVTDSANETRISDTSLVTVNPVPRVVITPTSVTIDLGQSQLFTSTVSGRTPPYTYQWYLNGSAISGATVSSWIFTPTSLGNYSVYLIVTDNFGTKAKSNTATVIVNKAPSVTISPNLATLDVGQSQLFTSTVSGGTSPDHYQWYLNGISVYFATSATWTFVPTSAGFYTVYLNVTDSVGLVAISPISNITVHHPNISVSKSGPTFAKEGTVITYNITAVNTGDCKLFNVTITDNVSGSIWTGELDAGVAKTFTIDYIVPISPSPAISNTVTVVGQDILGVVVSNSASFTVIVLHLASTISPSSATIDLGQSQTFASTVYNGTPAYSYQWYLNDVAVSGATSATWTFVPSSPGSYKIYLNITDSVGVTAVSNAAAIRVNGVPTVTISPSLVPLDVGQSQLFTSTVSDGTFLYYYQWYLDDVPVTGATDSTWTFTPNSSGSYNVSVSIMDSVGLEAKSNVAQVTVNPPLSLEISPAFVTLDAGQSQLFTSTVSAGTLPYSYQWYLNGASILGATGTTWTSNFPSAGYYWISLEITDGAGAKTTSNTATIIVHETPNVSISPSSAIMGVNQSELFTSNLSGGTSAYSYQWYINDTLVPGATSITWVFPPSSPGYYLISLKITDVFGTNTTSNNATITRALYYIAVTNTTTSKTVAGQGSSNSINVTVTNQGTYIETFKATAYANATYIASQNITLSIGKSSTTTFVWNTTGFAKGNYILKILIGLTPGKTNVANNTYSGCWVKITTQGDANGDGKVNVLDLILIANCIGHHASDYTPLSTDWYKFNNCDLNSDGNINVLDLIACANHL